MSVVLDLHFIFIVFLFQVLTATFNQIQGTVPMDVLTLLFPIHFTLFHLLKYIHVPTLKQFLV